MILKLQTIVTLLVTLLNFITLNAHPTDLSGVKAPSTSKEALTSSEEEQDWSYDESLENSCPADQFWHIRGRRCVPFKCPRGNWLRDWKTGTCLYTHEDMGQIRKFNRDGYAFRTVLRPLRNDIHAHMSRGGGVRYTGPRYAVSVVKKRVMYDENTGDVIRQIGLIG